MFQQQQTGSARALVTLDLGVVLFGRFDTLLLSIVSAVAYTLTRSAARKQPSNVPPGYQQIFCNVSARGAIIGFFRVLVGFRQPGHG
jgi:hypothetical protein